MKVVKAFILKCLLFLAGVFEAVPLVEDGPSPLVLQVWISTQKIAAAGHLLMGTYSGAIRRKSCSLLSRDGNCGRTLVVSIKRLL